MIFFLVGKIFVKNNLVFVKIISVYLYTFTKNDY